LTGAAVYHREAEAALASTLPGLGPPVDDNFSLCHGAAGNAELPLYASRVLDRLDLRTLAEDCARWGAETYELAGRPWPCGTADRVNDPSLMLGEAGIGHFYLRLAGAAPPVLFHEPPPPAAPIVEDDGYRALAEAWTEECFGATRRRFAVLGAMAPPPGPAGLDPDTDDRSPVERAHGDLRRLAEGAGGRRGTLLADAFRVDHARHRLAAAPDDLAAAYLRRLARPPAEAVDWQQERFVTAPGVDIVTTLWDWNGWPSAEPGAAPASGEPPEEPNTWILASQRGRVLCRPAGPLAAIVLATLAEPAKLDRIVGRLAAALDGDGAADMQALAARVVQQLGELYRAGLVDAVEGPSLESSTAGDGRLTALESGGLQPHPTSEPQERGVHQ
jgi:hypothetical protein